MVTSTVQLLISEIQETEIAELNNGNSLNKLSTVYLRKNLGSLQNGCIII